MYINVSEPGHTWWHKVLRDKFGDIFLLENWMAPSVNQVRRLSPFFSLCDWRAWELVPAPSTGEKRLELQIYCPQPTSTFRNRLMDWDKGASSTGMSKTLVVAQDGHTPLLVWVEQYTFYASQHGHAHHRCGWIFLIYKDNWIGRANLQSLSHHTDKPVLDNSL